MSTTRTTSIKFSGLASGLDTESLVNAMILPYKYKADAAVQQQKMMELRKDAWKDMNNTLNTFMKKVLDPMRLEGTFNKTSTTVSHPNLIELDKNIDLPAGTHTFEIEQIAKGANVSTGVIKDLSNKTVNKDTLLSDISLDLKDKEIGLAVGKPPVGVSVKITDDIKTIADLEKAVNVQLKEKNLDDVNFKFDDAAGGFVIGTKSTGDIQKISLTGNEDALKSLKIGVKADGSFEKDYSGQNAKVTYNGGLSFESATNQISINGVKINVLGASSETVTITATKDTTAIFDFVTNFVEEYNKLIDDFNTKIDAPKNKDYQPLTDEQKKEMSESDIKLWEEKIQKSLFSGDSTLKNITNDMRQIVGGTYEYNGKKISFASIGVTTSDWKEKGKLHIDEEKLKKAISENPDQVVSAITQIGKSLHTDFRDKLKGNVQKSGNSFYNDLLLDEQLREQKTEVSKLQDRLAAAEKKYYAQFTAMEKMMSQLNSQSQFLSSQLGGM